MRRIHETAIIEDDVSLGDGTSVWDNVHIRHGASLGEDCIVGGKSYVAYDVRIGNRVKINANVYVCNGVTVEDGVMLSAGVVFTNDRFPRAVTSDLSQLRPSEPDLETMLTTVREGATIGAGAIIGCDLEIGRFAMIGMGAVVTRTIGDFCLAIGNPARVVGFVCRCGNPIARFDRFENAPVADRIECERCGRVYRFDGDCATEQTT